MTPAEQRCRPRLDNDCAVKLELKLIYSQVQMWAVRTAELRDKINRLRFEASLRKSSALPSPPSIPHKLPESSASRIQEIGDLSTAVHAGVASLSGRGIAVKNTLVVNQRLDETQTSDPSSPSDIKGKG